MTAIRPIALIFALSLLSACAYSPGAPGIAWHTCSVDLTKHLRAVDWKKAKRLDLRIRQGDFRPSYMGLIMNQAYVLAIENADDSTHSFRAMDFFRAVAVGGVRTGGGVFEKVECLQGVSIPPGMTTEIRFVAVRDGSYEFDNNSLMISLAMIGSAGGFITIEPPRKIVESPLKHLDLRRMIPLRIEPDKQKAPGLFDDDEGPAPAPSLFDDEEEEPPAGPPSGLFDDEETPPAEPPSGLFDDEETPPAEPPSGLFDDAEPEQPIAPAPSQPVDAAPIQPELPEAEPDEGLFGEPAPELQPEPSEPETPVVEAPPEQPGEGLFAPDEELLLEEETTLKTIPEQPGETMFDEEEEMFVKEEPVVELPPETAPQPPVEGLEETIESTTAITGITEPEPAPAEQAPAAMPEWFEPIEGPPADIYSDPPDVVNTGPGPGGDSGEDVFDSAG